jgi:hypothetical protein
VLFIKDTLLSPAMAELSVDEVKAQALPLVSSSPTSREVFPEINLVPSVWSALPELLPQLASENPKPEALNPTNDFALWSGQRHRG